MVRVNRRFDVPFIGGGSKKGRTVYVDRRVKGSFRHKGKSYNGLRFLVLHEQIEQAHFRKGASYKKAHAQADKVEMAAVKRAGVPVGAYKKWTAGLVFRGVHERTHHVPRGLDRKPYKQTGSLRLLRRR